MTEDQESDTSGGGGRIAVVDYLVLGAEGAEPKLVANRCVGCGALYLDRRNGCARCGALEFEPHDLSSTGVLRSFTIVHRAAPNVAVPYVSSVVELDGGGVVKANLVDAGTDPDGIKLGTPVRLTTFVCDRDANGTEAVAFGFSAA